MRRATILLLSFFLSAHAGASTVLVTPEYRLEFTLNCAEGNVTCDDVELVIYNNLDQTIKDTAKGKTRHTTCADGLSPCRFIGYTFISGAATYEIHEDGKFEVFIDAKTEPFYSSIGIWE